jgi:hypothetical protein
MNDFDFLIGSWTVVNRRLRTRLTGDDDWEVYPATSECQRLLDGGGILDEMYFPTTGARGLSLRLYDSERKEWSIYWANGRNGALDPPLVGTFDGDRGDFYADDVYDGKPIKVHFLWTGTAGDSPRWEQAFSADGGQTWESNWVMEFTRAG